MFFCYRDSRAAVTSTARPAASETTQALWVGVRPRAASTIALKSLASRLAPPISTPSTSGLSKIARHRPSARCHRDAAPASHRCKRIVARPARSSSNCRQSGSASVLDLFMSSPRSADRAGSSRRSSLCRRSHRAAASRHGPARQPLTAATDRLLQGSLGRI